MEKITHFICRFNFRNVPKEEILLSKYVLLDCIGQLSKGTQKSDYEKVFWQAYELVKEEMDEGNALAKGHPACHFVPALLQIAKTEQSTFEQLLEAFLCGYEVSARTGEIITLKETIHPHSNWGVIGGIAALAKLYKWDEQQIERAIHLAGQLVFPTLWEPILEGFEGRNALIGLNNVHLLLLKPIIESGISSSPNTWSIMFEKVLGEKFNIADWNDDLNDYYIRATYFKFYNSCRFCHAPIDLVNKFLQTNPEILIDHIKKIEIETYSHAAKLNNQSPNNAFAGKFSIPYAVASAIMQDQQNETLIREFSKKILVTETAEMNALLPNRGTKMIIYTDDKSYELFQQGALGDQQTPNLYDLVCNKFIKNVESNLTEQEARDYLESVLEKDFISYEWI